MAMKAMVFLMLAATATLFSISHATTYTVGDTTGWVSSLSSTDFYDNWTDNKTFMVGDVLVFNFATGAHDVARVTEANYDSCNTANTLSVDRTSPVSITLNTTGDHYFLCTFPNHCSAGQKLDVKVVTSTNTSSGPSGTPPGTTTTTNSPPPPSSSASSFAASIPIFLTAVVMLLMC